jgi:putative Mn2+ efflux pump MntP
MFSLETTMLGLALALDAAVVSFAIGLLHTGLNRSQKITRGLYVCGVFGLFQFLMLWLGSYGGYRLSFSRYGHLFHIIIAASFLIIGSSMLSKSFDRGQKTIRWGILPTLLLGVATSMDALASGLSLGTLPRAYLVAFEIGIITFFLSGLSYYLSSIIETLSTAWPLRIASCVFFYLGGRIMVGYIL